jgi:hypothetical protein
LLRTTHDLADTAGDRKISQARKSSRVDSQQDKQPNAHMPDGLEVLFVKSEGSI